MIHARRIRVSMVANVCQTDMLVSHVNVHLVLLVSDAKIKILVPVNRVKIVVCALIQLAVDMSVSVVVVLMGQTVNKVS